jgi:hypothetical protein
MEAQLAEAATYPAQAYANSFFAEYPTDSRFLQCTFQKIPPTSSIDGKTIEFNLDRYDAANVYQIQETYVEVSVSILKNNGTDVPAIDKTVGTVNNLLHSLFESVRIIVNDVPITVSPGNYPYKAYIANCLSFPPSVKTCQLACQGWISDTAPHMGPTISNAGFESRSLMFRKNYDQTKPYRKEGVTLFGRLMHDLVTCETGLPPNTKVKIELDRSSDEFVVMCPTEDKEKYKIKILNIALYVPVAQLSAAVFNEISAILTRKTLPKVITIHYRRIEVRPVAVPKNKITFYSDSIFNDADLPCRIVVCFVDAVAKNGSYDTNPFDFQRSWEVEVDEDKSATNSDKSEREKILEKTVFQLQKDLAMVMTLVNEKKQVKGKGKGRGKRSKPVEEEPRPGTSFEAQVQEEAQRRLREFMGCRNRDVDVESGSTFNSARRQPSPEDLMTDDNSSVVTLPEKTKKNIFISKIELCLNQNKIDQIEDNQTEDECMQAYWRMSAFNGQMNNQHSAGITYDDFRQLIIV